MTASSLCAAAASVLLLLRLRPGSSLSPVPSVRGRGNANDDDGAAGGQHRGLMTDHSDFSPLSCNANLTVSDCDLTANPAALTLSSVLQQSSNGTAEALVPCGTCAVATVTDGSTLLFSRGLNVEGMLYFPPSSNATIEATHVFVQGILKVDPPAAGNTVRFSMIGDGTEGQYLFPHPENAMACNATTGCAVGKRPFVVAGGTLDVVGMEADGGPTAGGSSSHCPGYVPLRSVSGSGETYFGRTEAENHDAQQGIETYDDIIGYFDDGDWMTYRDVDLGPEGGAANTIRLRYSKGNSRIDLLEARLGGPDGQVVGTYEPSSTASWGTYVEDEFEIYLGEGASGLQNLTLKGVGNSGIMNLDWWEAVRYEDTLETRLEVGPDAAACWGGILTRRGEIDVLVTSAEGGGTWLGHHVLASSRIDLDPTTGRSGSVVVSGLTPRMIFSDGDRPPTLENEPHFAAEVAVLTRPVVFDSVQDGPSSGGHADLHGGHLIVYHTPHVAQRLEGVEVRGFGQQGNLGRYPVHFHMCGNVDGSVVRNNAVVDSNQRCVVVHRTNGVRVEDNVAYNSFGHCYILEDGVEEDNHFVGNLGALTRNQLIGIGATDHEASLFWITNTKNHFVNNVATGSQDVGVWFETNNAARYFPLYTFDGMVMHNNNKAGLITYRPGWRNPTPAVFNDLISYKNGGHGVNLHGTCRIKIKNGIIAANGVMVAGNRPGSNILEDTQIYALDDLHAAGGRCIHGNRQTGVTFSLEPNYEMVRLTNVTFRGFGPAPSECTQPGRPISLYNGNDIRDKYNSPTSWSGIHFDSTPPYAFDVGATNYYQEIIYLEDKDGTMTPNLEPGFFVADKPFMTAFIQDSCLPDVINDRTTFCPGVCLRRLQVNTGCCSKPDSDPNPLPIDYRMVVTSQSDASKTFTYDKSTRRSWPFGTKYNDNFDLVLPGGQEYDVSFVDLDGNEGFPDAVLTLFDAPACGDHITAESIRFATASPTSVPSSSPTASAVPTLTASDVPSSAPTLSSSPTRVPTPPINLSVGRPASHKCNYGSKYPASNAVDGIINNRRRFSTATCKTQNAWWKVDLQATKEIASVALWNRGDCCRFRLSNFFIRFLDDNGNQVKEIYNEGGLGGDEWTKTFYLDENVFAYYVQIQLTASEPLWMTEVRVMGWDLP